MNRLALAVGLIAATLVDVRDAHACATAPPSGAEVKIADEEALIVWDAATKTEQFIRRARFSSTAQSFGFLVPTPTVPKLDEVPDSIFYGLADAIRPEIVHDTSGFDVEAGSLLWQACAATMMKKGDSAAAPTTAVRVIAVAHVAGFEATTVEADDASALATWLADHGFASTPELTQWLERYVQDRWKITAFVVATDEKQGTSFDLATRAVRMTFQTDKPFYPYREPAAATSAADRMLRVFLVADQRYQALVAQAPWHAKVLYSARLNDVGELSRLTGPGKMLTVWVDDVAPRKGVDELYFVPSSSTTDVKQPPIVVEKPTKIFIPIDLILVLGLIGFAINRRRRR